MSRKISRRQMIGSAAAAWASVMAVPRHVLGLGQTPPSEIIRVAGIGVGGQGASDLNELAKEKDVQIVALCDVDDRSAKGSFEKFPEAARYKDFRKMIDEHQKDFDAVLVATPDHMHAPATLASIWAGKHVYCEKPLAHSIFEVREIQRAATAKQVITQLGNQGHSYESIRVFCEWIWDGAIGDVHTIHAGCNANHSKIGQLAKMNEKHKVPPELDWELWLGPTHLRPYNPMYLPGNWRGWSTFGTGTVGDWTCHVIDPVFWALDLGSPATVKAEAKDYDPQKHGQTFPSGTTITYKFDKRGTRGPLKLVWHDGTESLPRPPEMEPDRKLPEAGAIVLGTKGGIMYGSHGATGVRIFPEKKMGEYKQPPKRLPRVKSHHHDWINAIRTGKRAGSDFFYGGPLTEIALLGVIATKMLGQELKWNGGPFGRNEEANALMKPEFRRGWGL
jgi:predicted dehydrogenase